MATFILYVSATFRGTESDDARDLRRFSMWSWTGKPKLVGGGMPGIDPKPGPEPDPAPEPEPDPDPEPVPPPAPNPGPDPGFPIDPFPRPVPVRVTTIFQRGFNHEI